MLSTSQPVSSMDQNRRTFLHALGITTAALAAGCKPKSLLGGVSGERKLDRIGIQLYTLRRQAATDLAGVLQGLSKIGYKEVEFAGYDNRSASEIREMLRQ